MLWARRVAALCIGVALVTACSFAPIDPARFAAGSNECPVTAGNGSRPPGETVESPHFLGNGEIWTVLWPEGVVLIPRGRVEDDGTLSMKFPWWRGVAGALVISGRRLDAPSVPLRADIPDGYGPIGFQATALIFANEGCWEVTGRVGEAELTFVTRVQKE